MIQLFPINACPSLTDCFPVNNAENVDTCSSASSFLESHSKEPSSVPLSSSIIQSSCTPCSSCTSCMPLQPISTPSPSLCSKQTVTISITKTSLVESCLEATTLFGKLLVYITLSYLLTDVFIFLFNSNRCWISCNPHRVHYLAPVVIVHIVAVVIVVDIPFPR